MVPICSLENPRKLLSLNLRLFKNLFLSVSPNSDALRHLLMKEVLGQSCYWFFFYISNGHKIFSRGSFNQVINMTVFSHHMRVSKHTGSNIVGVGHEATCYSFPKVPTTKLAAVAIKVFSEPGINLPPHFTSEPLLLFEIVIAKVMPGAAKREVEAQRLIWTFGAQVRIPDTLRRGFGNSSMLEGSNRYIE